MSDISLSLGLDAQQLYNELQQAQTHLVQFASRLKAEGNAASKNFTSGFGGGLGDLKGLLTGALSTLGITLGASAITAEVKEIVEQAHLIHHEAARFGLDAEQLQLIANAAKSEGLSIEQAARALNFLTMPDPDADAPRLDRPRAVVADRSFLRAPLRAQALQKCCR